MQRKLGQRIALENYDPDVHRLPPNRAARRAVAAVERRAKRRQARAEVALEQKVKRLIAPYVGKPFTADVRNELIAAVQRELGWSLDAVVEALKAAGFEA